MGIIDLDSTPPSGDPTFVKEVLFIDYRAHEFSDGSFKIFKDIAEEPTYEIHPTSGCNCPAATWRNNGCKHEKMVGFKNELVIENTDIIVETKLDETLDIDQLKNDLF